MAAMLERQHLGVPRFSLGGPSPTQSSGESPQHSPQLRHQVKQHHFDFLRLPGAQERTRDLLIFIYFFTALPPSHSGSPNLQK
jgi:hypothetical protein